MDLEIIPFFGLLYIIVFGFIPGLILIGIPMWLAGFAIDALIRAVKIIARPPSR
jgi:hypothetical protein